MVHTPSRRAGQQALRSALVLSANDDGQITLTEILENYPTAVVEVEGDRLESAYRLLQRLNLSELGSRSGTQALFLVV